MLVTHGKDSDIPGMPWHYIALSIGNDEVFSGTTL